MKRKFLISAFFIFGIQISFACSQKPQEFGVLEGHVTIGPLVPVIREGETEPTAAPEVYAAREIVIFEEDGKTEIMRVKIDASGNYRAELPVGIWVVDINRSGIDSAPNLPKKIVIADQGVISLDIDIDTGIR